jgi:hypothetical protein
MDNKTILDIMNHPINAIMTTSSSEPLFVPNTSPSLLFAFNVYENIRKANCLFDSIRSELYSFDFVNKKDFNVSTNTYEAINKIFKTLYEQVKNLMILQSAILKILVSNYNVDIYEVNNFVQSLQNENSINSFLEMNEAYQIEIIKFKAVIEFLRDAKLD